MSVTLNQAIDRQIAAKWRVERFFGSIYAIGKEKGLAYTSLGLLVASVGFVYSLTASAFCMKSSVDSLNATIHGNHTLTNFIPLGDVGDWLSVAVCTVLGTGNAFIRITREGEYYKLNSICRKWMVANNAAITSNVQDHSKLYSELNELWDAFNLNCLFTKSLLSRRITVLEIYNRAGLPDAGPDMLIDKQLESLLMAIQNKIERKTSSRRCCSVVAIGQKAFHHSSAIGQVASLVIGVAMPIFFSSVILLSWTGGVASAYKVFHDHQVIDSIGTLGDWMINALAAASAMVVLPQWALTNEGVFSIARKVYAKKLAMLQNNAPLHNRLCELANQDLNERAGACLYAKYPMEYKFSKI